ncbi:MAG: hypothetical protein ACIAS6_10210 [Phycisphaerales bacterium JB060]
MTGAIRITMGAACSMALLLGACEEEGDASGSAAGPAPGQVTASQMPERDAETGENPEVDVYLPDARALGIEGWQDAGQRLGRGDQAAPEEEFPLAQSEGRLRAIAETNPELSVIPGEDGTPHLVGLADPRDTAALMGIFGSVEVKARGMSSVPPDGAIRSLGEMAAAAIQLVGEEPSADALLGSSRGPDADRAIAARLERAAAAWPKSARVWRVIGLPPDGQEELSIRFGPDNDPDDDRDEARHRQLQRMGILEFAPIEGGGPGDLISTSVTFDYQGNDQADRQLSVRFLYDRGTDRWVLRSIGSAPSMSTMSRLMEQGRGEEINGMAHSLDMLELLPECHLVVGKGGPLLCK